MFSTAIYLKKKIVLNSLWIHRLICTVFHTVFKPILFSAELHTMSFPRYCMLCSITIVDMIVSNGRGMNRVILTIIKPWKETGQARDQTIDSSSVLLHTATWAWLKTLISVGKAEYAGNQHFILFPTLFSTLPEKSQLS